MANTQIGEHEYRIEHNKKIGVIRIYSIYQIEIKVLTYDLRLNAISTHMFIKTHELKAIINYLESNYHERTN